MNKDGVFDSVLGAIGQTPLVDLQRLTTGRDGRILAKLEFLNPGFSKKDRIALQIIEDATASGALQPGQTVVELTSGNTGTGLAIACGIHGHPFVAVMSKGNSPERAQMMKALGAEVVLVEQSAGSVAGQVSGDDLALVEIAAQRVVEDRKAFRADQFQNESNFRAHYLHTAPEMLRQADGKIDAFCDFVGTGGTFAGCAAALKEFNPAIRCFVVEPKGAAVLAEQEVSTPSHRIQGGGYSMPELSLINRAQIDGYIQVTDEAAMDGARRLAKEEGIFGGFSSGANVVAALELLEGKMAGKTVAILIPDSGLKYLSTELWV